MVSKIASCIDWRSLNLSKVVSHKLLKTKTVAKSFFYMQEGLPELSGVNFANVVVN